MIIKLYAYQGDKILADKSSKLIELATLDATIVGDFNILSPTIRVETANSTFNANYVYIQDFGLYYFITEKQGLTAHHIDLKLTNDVRYSYLNAIKVSDVVATRSNFYNKNIPDKMALNIANQRVQYRKLSSALSGSNYICIIGG